LTRIIPSLLKLCLRHARAAQPAHLAARAGGNVRLRCPGNLSARTDFNGKVTTYSYDAVGNRQSRASTVPAIPAAPPGALFYDANGRVAQP